MAEYIGVDFRDGTGPSALPPNDVARAFRDAEDCALLGRGTKLWSRFTDDDGGVPGVGAGRDCATGGRVGRGGNADTHERRRRVVHVESATTGTFFKVKHGITEGSGAWWFVYVGQAIV